MQLRMYDYMCIGLWLMANPECMCVTASVEGNERDGSKVATSLSLAQVPTLCKRAQPKACHDMQKPMPMKRCQIIKIESDAKVSEGP